MEPYPSDDYETPIEELPGYLGYTWDGEFVTGSELQCVKDFDWGSFAELLEEAGDLTLAVEISGADVPVIVRPYGDLAFILDQLPTITVFRDLGPPDAGPASGSGYIFTMKDGVSTSAVVDSAAALRAGLDRMLAELQLRK